MRKGRLRKTKSGEWVQEIQIPTPEGKGEPYPRTATLEVKTIDEEKKAKHKRTWKPLSIRVPLEQLDLLDDVRDAVYYTPGATMNEFLLEAIREKLERERRTRNKGKPFPKRGKELQRGRRVRR